MSNTISLTSYDIYHLFIQSCMSVLSSILFYTQRYHPPPSILTSVTRSYPSSVPTRRTSLPHSFSLHFTVSLGTVNFKFEDLENAVKIRNILNFNGNANNQKSFPDLFNSFINEDSLEGTYVHSFFNRFVICILYSVLRIWRRVSAIVLLSGNFL